MSETRGIDGAMSRKPAHVIRRRRSGLPAAALGAAAAVLAACEPAPPAAPPPSTEAPSTAPPGAAAPTPVPAPSPPGDPRGTYVGFDAGEIKPVDEYLREPRFAAADLERGELLSLSCQACHTLRPGQPHLLGPNLNGMFGRAAATQPGFRYSGALESADIVWTPRTLEAWLAEPARFVVGTTMGFTGYRSDSDRRDLIAYLLNATSQEPAAR